MNVRGLGEQLLKWFVVIGAIASGSWALFHWYQAGADDWMVNLDMVTETLPYTNESRLLVIHVKSKNPTPNEIEFKRRDSSFTLTVREVPVGLAPGNAVAVDNGAAIGKPMDLMAGTGESYIFMPGAEFDDMEAIIVRPNSTVFLSAVLTRKAGRWRDEDFVSVERVVRIDK